MASIQTTYPGGGAINVNSAWDRPDVPGAAGLSPFFMEAIRRKMMLDEQRQQEELNAGRDDRALRRYLAEQSLQPREAAQGPEAAAPIPHRRPVFTKMIGGPSMVPGRIRLNQWEPGADYSGDEEELGSGPARSEFQPGGADTIASRGGPGAPTHDLNEQVTGQRLEDINKGGGGGGTEFERARMGSALNRSNDEFARRQEAAAAQRKALLRSVGVGA